MPKVFAIYPTDQQQSTKFLNKINTYLERKLGKDWHCYKVKFTADDHNHCIAKARLSNAKFIILMGHGRSDCFYGSCAKESSLFASETAMDNDERYYNNEDFINSVNIAEFRDKIIFSFSCNSNQNSKNSLARTAISKGVLSFIGFGNIPTDEMDKSDLPNKAIAIFKGLITKIIKQSIYLAVSNNYSADSILNIIKILTNKEIQQLILARDKSRFKEPVIRQLLNFKNEIVCFGNAFELVV